MEINLRKASAIQNSINDVLRNISITTSISINEFQDPAAELQRANDELFHNDARRQKLLLALYNIRGLVGTANSASGITTLLAKAAFIDKRINQLEDISHCNPVTEMGIISGKLSKIAKTNDNDSFSRRDEVTTSVVAKNQIDQTKAEIKNLKRQKIEINDEILELNIKTEIPLSDDVVDTLKEEGIL